QLLPAGNLREQKSNASRADVIVITKCPVEFSESEKDGLRNEVRAKENQPIFFSSIEYGKPFSLFEKEKTIEFFEIESAVLITGIAASHHLFNYLHSLIPNLKHEKFYDHHDFSLSELNAIAKKYLNVNERKTVFLTTEKDGVRLFPFRDFFSSHQLEIYCVPVEVAFSPTEKEKFDSIVLDFVKVKQEEENL
ncbi:MAG: tetraacyldisaccharide 4'-kinase, partial [Chitinophagales bacterium]|nr:tetraacyldisaccharide 4'-kinase [Chitinophagales bacterium]